jgi:hypothetical protein
LNCQGRLLPLQYTASPEINPAPKSGISDWYPRGTVFKHTSVISNDVLISATTGSANQFVIAVALPTAPAPGTTATLKLAARRAVPRSYRQYSYTRTAEFTVIQGREDGVAGKSLTYDPSDIVEVFIDGTRREQGTGPNDFQIFDGVIFPGIPPNVPPNTIVFNSPVEVSTTSQIDVIVSQPEPLQEIPLTFTLNSGSTLLPAGAWRNVKAIQRRAPSSTFYLFTHEVSTSSGLPENSILFPVDSVILTPLETVSLSQVHILLARKPYSQVDRYIDIYVVAADLDGQGDYLKYSPVDGVQALQVTERTLTTSYPPGQLIKFSPEPIITEPPGSSSEQVTVDGKVIVGPDT